MFGPHGVRLAVSLVACSTAWKFQVWNSGTSCVAQALSRAQKYLPDLAYEVQYSQ